MANNEFLDRWKRPETFFYELIKDGSRNDFVRREENSKVFYRALVVAVDVFGGKLENETGDGSILTEINGEEIELQANIGPNNPKNSVKARILTDYSDQLKSNDDLFVFWPFMPEHDMLPIKVGEHVYVLFEDQNFNHGLWLGKVSGHNNVNFFNGNNSYEPYDRDRLLNSFNETLRENKEIDNEAVLGGRLAKNNRNKFKLFGI